VLSVLKYYNHGATNDVLNGIRCVYREDGDYYEDDARLMGVRY
jgi:hypothetical protein